MLKKTNNNVIYSVIDVFESNSTICLYSSE